MPRGALLLQSQQCILMSGLTLQGLLIELNNPEQ
jgi:hypothetical protein